MKFSLLEPYRNEIIALAEGYNKELADNFKQFQEEIVKISAKAHYDKLHKALKRFVDSYNKDLFQNILNSIAVSWLESGTAFRDYTDTFRMGDAAKNVAYVLEGQFLEACLHNNMLNLFEDIAFEGEPKAERGDFEQAKDCFAKYKDIVEKTTEWYLGHLQQYRREENEFFMAITPVVVGFGAATAAFVEAGRVWVNELEEEYLAMMAHKRSVAENVYKNGKYVGATPAVNKTTTTSSNNNNVTNQPLNTGNNYRNGAEEPQSNQSTYAKLITALKKFASSGCTYKNCDSECQEYLKNVYTKIENNWKAEQENINRLLEEYRKQLEQNLKESKKNLEKRFVKGTLLWSNAEMLYAENCARAETLYHNQQYYYEMQRQALNNKANQLWEQEKFNANRRLQQLKQSKAFCSNLYKDKQNIIEELKRPTTAFEAVLRLKNHVSPIMQVCPTGCPQMKEICKLLNAFMGNLHFGTAERNVEDTNLKTKDFSSNMGGLTPQKLKEYDSIHQQIMKSHAQHGFIQRNKNVALDLINKSKDISDKEKLLLYDFYSQMENYDKKWLKTEKDVEDYLRQQLSRFKTVDKDVISFVAKTTPGYNGKQKQIDAFLNHVAYNYSGVNVKDGNYKNFDMGYRETLLNRKSRAISSVASLFDCNVNNLLIMQDDYVDKETPPHYKCGVGVYFSANDDATNLRGTGSTFYHEMGHMLDNNLGQLSHSQQLTESLEKDKNNIIEFYKNSTTQERDAFIKYLKSHQGHSLSDILEGMKVHVAFNDQRRWGAYGHNKDSQKHDYWSYRDALEKEVFAHLVEASISDNIDKQKWLNYYLMNTCQTFLEIIQKALGRNFS